MADDVFGVYRLEGLLGRGGMGEVHRAFDTVKKRSVALKLLSPHLASDAEFQARFRRESEVAARLREAHVIPIHDYGEIDGRLYIDMRLVDGIDLDTVVARDGPMSPERAVRVVAQIASALDAAHADGLVHRDVKPSNVLLSGTGEEFAYLVDFGIAAPMQGDRLTVTGSTLGTMGYMAPELYDGNSRDGRIDVYSLACVFYKLLTGRKPFEADGFAAMMFSHLNVDPPRPSQFAGVPAGFDEVVARGMAKDPERRYARAGELADAARAVLTSAPPVAVPPAPVMAGPAEPSRPLSTAPTELVRPARPRRRLMAIGVAVLVAAVLIVAGIVVARPGGPLEATSTAVGAPRPPPPARSSTAAAASRCSRHRAGRPTRARSSATPCTSTVRSRRGPRRERRSIPSSACARTRLPRIWPESSPTCGRRTARTRSTTPFATNRWHFTTACGPTSSSTPSRIRRWGSRSSSCGCASSTTTSRSGWAAPLW